MKTVGGFGISVATSTGYAVMTPVPTTRQARPGLKYPLFYYVNLTTATGLQPLFFLPFVGMTVAP